MVPPKSLMDQVGKQSLWKPFIWRWLACLTRKRTGGRQGLLSCVEKVIVVVTAVPKHEVEGRLQKGREGRAMNPLHSLVIMASGWRQRNYFFFLADRDINGRKVPTVLALRVQGIDGFCFRKCSERDAHWSCCCSLKTELRHTCY